MVYVDRLAWPPLMPVLPGTPHFRPKTGYDRSTAAVPASERYQPMPYATLQDEADALDWEEDQLLRQHSEIRSFGFSWLVPLGRQNTQEEDAETAFSASPRAASSPPHQPLPDEAADQLGIPGGDAVAGADGTGQGQGGATDDQVRDLDAEIEDADATNSTASESLSEGDGDDSDPDHDDDDDDEGDVSSSQGRSSTGLSRSDGGESWDGSPPTVNHESRRGAAASAAEQRRAAETRYSEAHRRVSSPPSEDPSGVDTSGMMTEEGESMDM